MMVYFELLLFYNWKWDDFLIFSSVSNRKESWSNVHSIYKKNNIWCFFSCLSFSVCLRGPLHVSCKSEAVRKVSGYCQTPQAHPTHFALMDWVSSAPRCTQTCSFLQKRLTKWVQIDIHLRAMHYIIESFRW